jgi:hypothetical protein
VSGRVRRSTVERCACGATIVGYVAGDTCPGCGEVVLDG